LPLHNLQLAAENTILSDANAHDYGRENSNPYSGASRSISRTISGILLLLFGASLVKMALSVTDTPPNPTPIIFLGWGMGLAGFASIIQGVVLVLVGRWLV
jgi:hypothetical protein